MAVSSGVVRSNASKLLYPSGLYPLKYSLLLCAHQPIASASIGSAKAGLVELTPVASYLKGLGVPINNPAMATLAKLKFANFDLDCSKRVISALRQLGFSERAVIEMVSTRPYILRVDAHEIRQRFRFLRDQLAAPLDLNEQELFRLLERQAYVIGSLHTPRRIPEKLALLSTLGLSKKDIRTIAFMDSRFTLVDIEENMKTAVNVLKQLGLTDHEVGHIVRTAPGIIGNIKETPRNRIAFFSHEFGWSKPEIAESLIAFPPLLRNDMLSMKLKHEIMKFVGYTYSDIRTNVYAFAYSLRRIYFRLLFAKALGATREQMMTVHSYMVVPLDSVLRKHGAAAEVFASFVAKNERNLLESKKSCSVIVNLDSGF